MGGGRRGWGSVNLCEVSWSALIKGRRWGTGAFEKHSGTTTFAEIRYSGATLLVLATRAS